MNNKPTSQPMGIGPLGEPTTVFVRKFRWTFGSPTLPVSFVQKVNFDFCDKTIEMDYLEVYTADHNGEHLQDWLDGPYEKDTLTFTTYDGCGTPLYEQHFSGLLVSSDTASFDYSSSDVSVRKLTIEYEKTVRNSLISFPRADETINNPRETTLNYLNSKRLYKV